MGAYHLMPRRTAAVYRSSETLASSSSESDGGGESGECSARSSSCPSPRPTSGRRSSETHVPGQRWSQTARRRASLDLSSETNVSPSRPQKSTGEETGRGQPGAGGSTPGELMLKLRLQNRLFPELCEGNFLALRGLERSSSGDVYRKPGHSGRHLTTNGFVPGKLRPCFSEGVKLSSLVTASSSPHHSSRASSSSNSLFRANNGLVGSLPSHQRQAYLQHQANQMLVSNETLEESNRWKRTRSYSQDSFESGDLRHGKRFLHGLQSCCSREITLSEDELTLSNVFQVRNF